MRLAPLLFLVISHLGVTLASCATRSQSDFLEFHRRQFPPPPPPPPQPPGPPPSGPPNTGPPPPPPPPPNAPQQVPSPIPFVNPFASLTAAPSGSSASPSLPNSSTSIRTSGSSHPKPSPTSTSAISDPTSSSTRSDTDDASKQRITIIYMAIIFGTVGLILLAFLFWVIYGWFTRRPKLRRGGSGIGGPRYSPAPRWEAYSQQSHYDGYDEENQLGSDGLVSAAAYGWPDIERQKLKEHFLAASDEEEDPFLVQPPSHQDPDTRIKPRSKTGHVREIRFSATNSSNPPKQKYLSAPMARGDTADTVSTAFLDGFETDEDEKDPLVEQKEVPWEQLRHKSIKRGILEEVKKEKSWINSLRGITGGSFRSQAKSKKGTIEGADGNNLSVGNGARSTSASVSKTKVQRRVSAARPKDDEAQDGQEPMGQRPATSRAPTDMTTTTTSTARSAVGFRIIEGSPLPTPLHSEPSSPTPARPKPVARRTSSVSRYQGVQLRDDRSIVTAQLAEDPYTPVPMRSRSRSRSRSSSPTKSGAVPSTPQRSLKTPTGPSRTCSPIPGSPAVPPSNTPRIMVPGTPASRVINSHAVVLPQSPALITSPILEGQLCFMPTPNPNQGLVPTPAPESTAEPASTPAGRVNVRQYVAELNAATGPAVATSAPVDVSPKKPTMRSKIPRTPTKVSTTGVQRGDSTGREPHYQKATPRSVPARSPMRPRPLPRTQASLSPSARRRGPVGQGGAGRGGGRADFNSPLPR